MIRYLLVVLAAGAAMAQTGQLDGPVLGLVSDGGAIRPLLGVPAAASLGAPIDGSGLSGAAFSARSGYVLGAEGDQAVVLTAAGRAPLAGAARGAIRFFTSPRGSAAAALRADSRTLDIFTGMPDNPRLLRSIALDAAPSRVALSDDGGAVVTVTHTLRGGDFVEWRAGDAPAQNVYRSRGIVSLSFVAGEATALVAERAAVKLVAPSFGAQTVAGGLDGVVDAAASADGSRIAIATASGTVLVEDRATQSHVSISCNCAPTALSPLRGGAVFRLNDPGSGPLWLLDADSPQPRILFVAVPAEAAR